MVQNAYPSTGITANSTLKVQSSPVGDDCTVFASSCNRGITPGAHCRGNECFQGVLTQSVSSPNVAVADSIDDDDLTAWNTPETHCCGNESFQGDLVYVRTLPKDAPSTDFSVICDGNHKLPKKDENLLSKKKSSSVTTCDGINQTYLENAKYTTKTIQKKHTEYFGKKQIENANIGKKKSEYPKIIFFHKIIFFTPPYPLPFFLFAKSQIICFTLKVQKNSRKNDSTYVPNAKKSKNNQHKNVLRPLANNWNNKNIPWKNDIFECTNDQSRKKTGLPVKKPDNQNSNVSSQKNQILDLVAKKSEYHNIFFFFDLPDFIYSESCFNFFFLYVPSEPTLR